MLTMGAKLTQAKLTLFAKILYKPSLNVTYNECTYNLTTGNGLKVYNIIHYFITLN